jgi:hypothetical protein
MNLYSCETKQLAICNLQQFGKKVVLGMSSLLIV